MLTNEEIFAHAKKVAIGMSKNQIENDVQHADQKMRFFLKELGYE